MRALLVLGLLLLVPMSGCVGAGPASGAKTTGPAPTQPIDNTTLHGKFLQAPHIKVLGPTTLVWALGNGSEDKPAWTATLVYFADAFKSSHHGVTDSMKLVAAIPADRPVADAACGPTPNTIRSYYDMRDTRASTALRNLTGTYGPGWYHFVLLSTDEGGFQVSFDTEKEGKGRALPPRDPFVTGGFARTSGGRELSLSAGAANGSWAGWASHEIDGSGTDGGRDHTATFDCQSGKGTTSGLSPDRQSRDRRAFASAVGTNAKFEIKGSYKPAYPYLAETDTVLEGVWFSAAMPVLG